MQNKINIEQNIQSINLIDDIKQCSELIEALKREISNEIIGNEEIINFIIISILCNGHILLEGVPGVAKTTIIKTISNTLGLLFKRIQFTPDLLPADLIGTLIYNPKTQEFETKKGPIFANVILADEINRAPAKVQSALLECMQEHQVTIGSTTFKLDEPFFVFATQNPIEQQGTYQLPEAQLDRFMFKLLVNYPSADQEKEVLKRINKNIEINQILNKELIFKMQELANTIYVDEKIIDYIINIVNATRQDTIFTNTELKSFIQFGASPRASISIYKASKVHALLKKRHFVIPDDIKSVALPILRHRITLSYEAQAEDIKSDFVIKKIFETVSSP